MGLVFHTTSTFLNVGTVRRRGRRRRLLQLPLRLYSIYMLMHFQCYEYTTTTLGIHWNDYEFTGLRQRLPLRLRQRTVGNIEGPRGQRGTLPPDPHEKHSTTLVALASPAEATPSSASWTQAPPLLVLRGKTKGKTKSNQSISVGYVGTGDRLDF